MHTDNNIVEHRGEYVHVETLVLDKQSEMTQVEHYKAQLINDVQPIFVEAHQHAAGNEARQAAIIQQWEDYQAMIHDVGIITTGMLEAVNTLKHQRDVTIHDHETLLQELEYATAAWREGVNVVSHEEIERTHSGQVSALIQAVDSAAHGHYADQYAQFQTRTAQNILADLTALITAESDRINHADVKNIMAYLTRNKGLSTDERNRAATALRAWADKLEVK